MAGINTVENHQGKSGTETSLLWEEEEKVSSNINSAQFLFCRSFFAAAA